MATNIGDHPSTLFRGLSDFWLRFFQDTVDLEAFYQASEIYLGDVYLDLLSSVLNIGLIDTPIFNKGYWKLFTIREDELLFSEGRNANENRYVYDMPGSIAHIDVMQNAIFEPGVLLERDADFDVIDNDGFVRFYEDIFRAHTDDNGDVSPLSGVAWRYVTLETGNRATDQKRTESWYDNTDVKRGDTFRIIGHRGARLSGPYTTDGTITFTGTVTEFESVAYTTFDSANVGDIVKVYNASTDAFNGFFVIKSIVSGSKVILENTTYVPQVSSLPTELNWELYKGVYLDTFVDSRIDYIDNTYLVGDRETPFTLAYDTELIYAVVRDVAEPDVRGVLLNSSPVLNPPLVSATLDFEHPSGWVKITAVGAGFTSGMVKVTTPPSTPLKDFYWVTLGADNYKYAGEYNIIGYIDADNVLLEVTPEELGVPTAEISLGSTVPAWKLTKTPPETQLGSRHIIDSSVAVHARKFFSGALVEGVDYSIDYFKGVFTPLKPFDPDVVHTCSYQFQKEVEFSASGIVSEYTEGRVQQLSLWVPEILEDKFNLYYNYGSLLNRFEASSENYKAFLRGIIHLYVSGPIFQRIEAAMNVAADLRVVRTDGEILIAYFDGKDAEGTDGELVDAFTDPLRPFDHFITTSYTFTEVDVGGYVVIEDALNEVNRGRFRILNVIATGVVEIETEYGVTNETLLNWVLTRQYTKTVTTNLRTYNFPYNVPMREDLEVSENLNVLTFDAFEPLTEAFTVTDYVEDPEWWHDKVIPELFWPNTTRPRRIATTRLYEHVIGPADDARIGDPGLYIGADDEGNVTQVSDAAALRHAVAFVLFDRYLKFHLFYVQISPKLELDQEFINDLEDLILVAKPSYTYPYVEPTETLEDTLALFESYFQEGYIIGLGDDEEIELADNEMIIGGDLEEMFMSIGDYFRYVEYDDTSTGVASPPGGAFSLSITATPPAKRHVIKLRLNATIGGKTVEEGVDYTFGYDPNAGSPWLVTPLTTWDTAADITFDALAIEIVNIDDVATPDTTIGFTPISIGGTNPGYVRKTITAVSQVTEEIDRTVSLVIDAGGGSPYTYP